MIGNVDQDHPPTEYFDIFDLNGDGILTFEELIEKFEEEMEVVEEVIGNADHSE